MARAVDFENVLTIGLESSPVAAALAGLRANEARYFKNRYDHVFEVEPAAKAKKTVDWVHAILKEERGLVIAARPLEATSFELTPAPDSPFLRGVLGGLRRDARVRIKSLVATRCGAMRK
jgi:hypothetical protein